MLEKLINSQARLKILALLFAKPKDFFYAQEIVKQTGLDAANVKKELANLLSGDFIEVKTEKGKKYFGLNEKNKFFAGLSELFAQYQETLNLDKWFLIEEIPKAPPSVALSYAECAAARNFFQKKFKLNNYCKSIIKYENGTAYLYHVRKEYKNLAEEVLGRLVADYHFGLQINETVKSLADDWQDFAKKNVCQNNLSQLDDAELLRIHQKLYSHQLASHVSGWPSNVVDFENSLFSKYLIKIIEGKKKESEISNSTGEMFSVLTTPLQESLAQKEYKDLIKLLLLIYQNQKLTELFANHDSRLIEDQLKIEHTNFYQRVNEHQKNYGWLGYGCEGPGWQDIYFIDILASLVRQRVEPETIIKELADKEQKNKELQEKYLKLLQLTEQERGLFEVARGFVFMKGYRKDRLFYGAYCMDLLLREIARRNYLSIRQLRYVYPEEMSNLLLKKKFDLNELNARFAYHVFYSDLQGNRILTGTKGRNFLERLDFVQENIKDVSMLLGDTASPGKVRGVVKIIITTEDMKKIKEGEILISIATTPDLVPAIKKAAAIVTDMGGVTCHAAIVSRELGIPCVIGTKIATKVLKDGDLVEVDASHGKVTIIREEKK